MNTFSNSIYEFLEISPQNELELDYLIKLSKRLGCFEEAQNHIFEFNPRFDENGRSQSFAAFYKEALLSEILWSVLYKIGKYITIGDLRDFNNPSEFRNIDEVSEEMWEDFAMFFYDEFLDNREDSKLIHFFLTTDLRFYTSEMIVYKMWEEFSEDFLSYND